MRDDFLMLGSNHKSTKILNRAIVLKMICTVLCLYISIGLISLVNMFDPRVIYLGHEIALAGNLVTEKLEAYIKDKTISSKFKDIPVEISAFDDKAPVIGSTAIVFDRLFKGF